MKAYLERYIEEHKADMLRDLAALVAIPSVTGEQIETARALELTLDLGASMGFRTENCLNSQVGVIEMGQGDETLGILSHVDVVPAGDPADWDTDPYTAVLKDGKVYGRGTIDDKGMIVATLYAMKATAEYAKLHQLPLRKKAQLILGTSEEEEWTDMDAYVAAYPLPDFGFSPDGEYPICNIEKGVADCTMEFSLEDKNQGDGLYVKSIDCGIATNAVPNKAVAILSDGEQVVADGKTVHSCQPEFGVNALFVLCEKLGEKGVDKNGIMNLLEAVTDAFSDIYGKAVGMYSESEYYQGEFVHRNVFSPTIFRGDCSKVQVNINLRFPYGVEEEALLAAMTKFAEEHGGQIAMWDYLPAVFVSKDRPFLQVLAQAYEEVSGLQNEFTVAYGGSYAKAMPNIVSWGPLFPGEEDMCHRVNEYIGIDSLMMSTKIFAHSIADILLTEESMK